jgi:hypothetical protein
VPYVVSFDEMLVGGEPESALAQNR